jgi:hypothetical protein
LVDNVGTIGDQLIPDCSRSLSVLSLSVLPSVL